MPLGLLPEQQPKPRQIKIVINLPATLLIAAIILISLVVVKVLP